MLAVATTIAATPAAGAVAPGDLDRSFGNGGVSVIDDPGGGLLRFGDAVARPDGGVVVAGARVADDGIDPELFGFTRAGAVDQSFGLSGTTILDERSVSEWSAIVRDMGGRFVVAGPAAFPGGIAIARFAVSGRLDLSFGDLGIDRIDELRPWGDVGLVQDEFGRVIVAAGTDSGQVVISRRLANGGADPSFGRDGVQVLAGDGEPVERVSLARGPGGRTVVAFGDYGRTYTVARLTPDGDLDERFAGSGTVTGSFGADLDHVTNVSDLAVTRDGEILIAGAGAHRTRHGGFRYVPSLQLLTPKGRPDRSFGRRGAVSFLNVKSGPGYDLPTEFAAIAIQRNRRIVAAGTRLDAFLVARYQADGRPDRSFSRNGWAATPIGDFAAARAVALTRNGRIVLAGPTFGPSPPGIALARYVGSSDR